MVYKSGPLFLSSNGIGWMPSKKRWFILIETSLVFLHSDPNASVEKGGEANLPLGGIDLNSSRSVAVKADKKLLTVLFPDGRNGRSFTLKERKSSQKMRMDMLCETVSRFLKSTCQIGERLVKSVWLTQSGLDDYGLKIYQGQDILLVEGLNDGKPYKSDAVLKDLVGDYYDVGDF